MVIFYFMLIKSSDLTPFQTGLIMYLFGTILIFLSGLNAFIKYEIGDSKRNKYLFIWIIIIITILYLIILWLINTAEAGLGRGLADLLFHFPYYSFLYVPG